MSQSFLIGQGFQIVILKNLLENQSSLNQLLLLFYNVHYMNHLILT